MRIKYVILLFFIVLVASCTVPEPQEPATTENNMESVKSAIDGWWEASKATNVDGMVQFMCDDVSLIPPNGPPVTGSDAHQFYRDVAEEYTFGVDLTTIETVVSGELSFHQYSYDITMTPRAEGDPIKQKGYGLNILQRQDDGSWCLSRLIWNVLPPPSDET